MTTIIGSKKPKSILKHNNDFLIHNSSNVEDDASINNANHSWFSKLNSLNDSSNPTSPIISPRINNLFSFKKQQSMPVQEENMLNLELAPREIRRVRFPVADITTEYVFKKEDILLEVKKQNKIEPIHIQTSGQLLSLYESNCRKKQEPTIDLFVATLTSQPNATFLTRLDLTNQRIDRYSISPLADIMSIGFGLQELLLTNCGLEDDAIKILMHSLLENDKIKYLSLAKNVKLSSSAFKYIAVYIKGSTQLATLDMSFTQPDKKGLQYILAASVKSNAQDQSPSLYNLILNSCNLRTPQLEVLSAGIKKPNSSIKQLSIRGNKILVQGALSIGVMLRDYDQSEKTNGLERLLLDDNDLSQGGVQYIAQALKRNQSLRHLSMCECKIDAKDFGLVCEALKYNQFLERLDIGYNTICSSNRSAIPALRQALNVNRSLKDLCLADIGLDTEATIALAECLSENNTIVRLDLSRNPKIQSAGLLAISASMKINRTITFIDIHIPSDDKEMVDIHNGIIAACTKNAQSKNTADSTPNNVDHSKITTAQKTARLTLEERLAAVTRGKNSRPTLPPLSQKPSTNDTVKKTPATNQQSDANSLLIQQAFDKVSSLEDFITGRILKEDQNEASILDGFHQCKELHSTICSRIPEVADPSQLELMLAINDRLAAAVQQYEQDPSRFTTAVIPEPTETQDDTHEDEENNKLSRSFEIGDDDDEDDELVDDLEKEDEGDSSNHLKELRSEIEAEESAAFLKAKKEEFESSDNE